MGQNGVKPDQESVKQDVEIKHEPGTHVPLPPLPSYNGADKNSLAASRAAQRLADQYGSLAAGSISAIQAGHKQQPQTQNPQPPQGQAPAGASTISNGQTDGPGDGEGEGEEEEDYEGILMRRNAEGTLNELGRVDIDRMLHGQMAARAKAMEGGGLMLPLKKAASHRGQRSTRAKGKGIAAYDGADDYDDIDDEDAINSDLDDPEDDHDDDEVDDEGLGHIMLCMYDKVQRVKNKWYVLRRPIICGSVLFETTTHQLIAFL